MAVIQVRKRHAVDTVDLPASARVIGLVLRRELEFSDIKVRPTNVTANIATVVTSITIGTAVQTVAGSFLLGVTFTAGNIQRSTITNNPFRVGNEIRIGDNDTSGANTVDAVVTNVSGNVVTYRIENTNGTGVVSPTGTLFVSLIEHDNDHEPNYILLHNGPAGGFRQELSIDASSGGIYRVNGVIEAVITA